MHAWLLFKRGIGITDGVCMDGHCIALHGHGHGHGIAGGLAWFLRYPICVAGAAKCSYELGLEFAFAIAFAICNLHLR